MVKLRSLPFFPYIAAILVGGVVFLAIFALRSAGYLEYLELVVYDGFVRLQPETSGSSPPIVIIEITEEDIRTEKRWPITDATMAQVLDTLNRYKPRAIGLDIFRDIGVPPGSGAFDSILKKNQSIIAVMKFGDNGVPPPQGISDTDRVGFNDILVDPGGIVRRGLLFLDDGEKIFYSFSLRLALQYLKFEGILPQPDLSNPQFIALGGTAIPPLEPNEGGYVRADSRGYQFLVDFGSSPEIFQTFSLTSLLSGKVPSKDISDKIVIIGVTAQSVKDFFYTPHSRRFQIHQQLPGVFVHAYIVNQLLRLALEGRLPRKGVSENKEMVWILLWSVMGGLIALWIRSPWQISLIGSASLLTLFSITYLAFLKAWWIPIVPPAMSWFICASIVTAYMSNHEKKQRSLLMQLFSR